MTPTAGESFTAVVTDLDGTVVRRDRTVSPATLRAAQALKEHGVPLLAATARAPAGVDALRTLAPLLTFAVCSSGAVGYIPATATVAWREQIPLEAVTELLAYLKKRLPAAGLAAFDGLQWRMTAAYELMRPSVHKGPVAVVPAEALTETNPCAMVICHPEWNAPELVAILTEAGLAGTRLGLHQAGPRFVEVTAAPVGKASGVLRALRTIGVCPDRAIAFGDMPIDIPMFTVVGHSVAMGDAPEEVLRAATTQTESVEDDGFARMLYRLGLLHASPRSEP